MNVLKLYRIARFLFKHNFIKLANKVTALNNIIHNSYIPHAASIPNSTKFAYGCIGVVIHAKTKLGENCTIGQGITIGGRTGHGGPPQFGNNVYISAGARVLGKIKIGNNVIIGTNAVVITDVPDNSIVAGVPGKIINRNVDKFKEEKLI